jgi:cobalt-zinc-cadmium efflux system membrane fusion protein
MKNIIIYSLIIIGLNACQSKDNTTNTVAEVPENTIALNASQLANIEISTVDLTMKPISNIIKAIGIIDVPPRSLVNISTPYGGYLKYTRLLPGQKIKKGETLAIIEDQQFIQLEREFLSIKNRLELVSNDFQKQKELYEQKAIAEKTYLEAKSNFEIMKIDFKATEEKLKLIGINTSELKAEKISSKIELKSPIDGYVSKVNHNVGKYLSANDVLFELINPDDIHLNIQIYQKDIQAMSIGQKVVAYSNEFTDKKYDAEVILIGRDLNENKAINVHCHFENKNHALLPGMYMNVEIESSLHQTLSVPSNSIQRFENKEYLIITNDGKTYELVSIKSGSSEKGYTEILNASAQLKKSKIVEKGAYQLLMAMKNKSEEE